MIKNTSILIEDETFTVTYAVDDYKRGVVLTNPQRKLKLGKIILF